MFLRGVRRDLQRAMDRRASLWVPAAYVLASLVIFGHGVLRHPATDYVGWSVGADAQAFIWLIGWWPHALLAGLNPFVTHAVDQPGGQNLAWVTSVPALSLALLPFTLSVGPVLSYNLAALLAPVLAAWTAFLLCRYLTRSSSAAAIAGAFFGFSPYMAGQIESGHLNLTSIYLVPLAALVVVRFLRGDLSARALVVCLGLIVAAQILLSTEIAFTLTLALAVCLAVASLSASSLRPRIGAATRPILGAYALGIVLSSPFLAYALIGYESKPLESPASYPADLLNLVVPTHPTLVSVDWTRALSDSFSAGDGESGAYLGLVAIAIVAVALWRARGSPLGRFFAAVLAAGVIAELGTRLHVHGVASVPLPWDLIARLPGFRNVLPVRLSMYVSLAVAVVIALFAATPGRHRNARLAVAAIALLTVVPSPRRDVWTTSPERLAFFTTRRDRACLRPQETVLLVPVPVQSYGWLWQAQAGYGFRMIDGNLAQSPPEPALFVVDISGRTSPRTAPALLALVRARGASAILVTAHFAFWHRLLEPYLQPLAVGGVVLYRLQGASDTAGRGSRRQRAAARAGACAEDTPAAATPAAAAPPPPAGPGGRNEGSARGL